MLVQDIRESATAKLTRLNDQLDQLFGLRIDYDSTNAHLRQVFEHYREMRTALLHYHGIAGLQNNPQYAKAILISEAVRLFLREIAPKRTKQKNG